MHVKASRIANLTDARYFAARGATYLGFCLDENSPHFIEPAEMRAIREWVAGPRIVGEFEHAPAAIVREAAAFFALDAVQVCQADLIPELQGLEVLLLLSNAEHPDSVASSLERARAGVAFFIVELTHKAAWAAVHSAEVADMWRQLCAHFPVLLDAPLPAESFASLLFSVQPAGFALRGSNEERPGVKSFEEIDALFDALDY